jgi:methyl-accepting chemotaxis protein
MSKVTLTARIAKGHIEKIQTASRLQTKATKVINGSLGELELISQQTAAIAGKAAASGTP